MPKDRKSEPFRMLEDFTCEAIPDPAFPQAAPTKQGQNEGIHVLPELAVDADEAIPTESKEGKDLPKR